jgi:hypothetical protein
MRRLILPPFFGLETVPSWLRRAELLNGLSPGLISRLIGFIDPLFPPLRRLAKVLGLDKDEVATENSAWRLMERLTAPGGTIAIATLLQHRRHELETGLDLELRGRRFPRICSECLERDLHEFGTPVLRVWNHLPGIWACPLHECWLIQTVDEIAALGESALPFTEPAPEPLFEFSKYVSRELGSPNGGDLWPDGHSLRTVLRMLRVPRNAHWPQDPAVHRLLAHRFGEYVHQALELNIEPWSFGVTPMFPQGRELGALLRTTHLTPQRRLVFAYVLGPICEGFKPKASVGRQGGGLGVLPSGRPPRSSGKAPLSGSRGQPP